MLALGVYGSVNFGIKDTPCDYSKDFTLLRPESRTLFSGCYQYPGFRRRLQQTKMIGWGTNSSLEISLSTLHENTVETNSFSSATLSQDLSDTNNYGFGKIGLDWHGIIKPISNERKCKEFGVGTVVFTVMSRANGIPNFLKI